MSATLADLPSDFNTTLLEYPELCTLETCPLTLGYVHYIPNLGGNILYVAVFGLALIVQLVFTTKHRTWGFGIAMMGGLALEVIGYIARIQMHDNPFLKEPFLMYLVCLTLGPAFFSAAIYLCLSRIVVVYGETISRLRPATYTIVFIGFDIIALLLQAIGGGIASTANTKSMTDMGRNIMVAGVSWQVMSLMVFLVLCTDFARRAKSAPETKLTQAFKSFRDSTRFMLFLIALTIATVTIFVRSVFRCAELSGGFDGKLANQEITFMILEGGMISVAVICLTAFHLGWVFRSIWHAASWNIRSAPETSTKVNTGTVDEPIDMEQKRSVPVNSLTMQV